MLLVACAERGREGGREGGREKGREKMGRVLARAMAPSCHLYASCPIQGWPSVFDTQSLSKYHPFSHHPELALRLPRLLSLLRPDHLHARRPARPPRLSHIGYGNEGDESDACVTSASPTGGRHAHSFLNPLPAHFFPLQEYVLPSRKRLCKAPLATATSSRPSLPFTAKSACP